MRCICLLALLNWLAWGGIVGQTTNGELDNVTDFAQKTSVSIPMPDGAHLAADVYLPVFMDSFSIPFRFPGSPEVQISLIKAGQPYIVYDSINGVVNPNPYELPTLFIRTPYNKNTERVGHLLAFLGYSVVIQDTRGAYASEGNYLPMFSDAWPKAPYHPGFTHLLDPLSPLQSGSANFHSDGVHSLQYLLNDLYWVNQGDSIKVSNGSVGMLGASALGNVQYQLAAAHKINPGQPGLKGLLPIVASNEHYKSTAVQNGVFREALVSNWIARQYRDLLDENDSATFHRAADFGYTDANTVAETAIDYWITARNGGQPAGYYPHSPIRAELDASFAPVNATGQGDANGALSRYTNMEVPMYHLTGWWDIFIDGQIETFQNLRQHLHPDLGNASRQKLVIGPWAHQTITELRTGDVAYPANVNRFLVDLQNFEGSNGTLPLGELLQSEIFSWLRYTLNQNEFKAVGSPKVVIKAATQWQQLMPGVEVRMPSKDYRVPYPDFINYLGGLAPLQDFPYALKQGPFEFENSFDVPPSENPVVGLSQPFTGYQTGAMDSLPPVRLYVAAAVQNGAGNYWLAKDSFPFSAGIRKQTLYLGADHSIQTEVPLQQGELSYVHDPDRPVLTVGGANMTVRTPGNERNSQGQMNLATTANSQASMNRADVLQFTSGPLTDSVTIIGYPNFSFYASSSPLQGPDSTDTDFFVRMLEVLPTGEEYFVVEGAINARARNYAAQMVDGDEDASLPFSNIAAGRVYAYRFKGMPIGYTFQAGSRLKVLISSSNYPRYQSNPNLPLAPGEFFRRKPGEDKSYVYNGVPLKARAALQRLVFSAEQPAQLELPVYNGTVQFSQEATAVPEHQVPQVRVFPNPASTYVSIITGPAIAQLEIHSIHGKKVLTREIQQNVTLDISHWQPGIYLLRVYNPSGNDFHTARLMVR